MATARGNAKYRGNPQKFELCAARIRCALIDLDKPTQHQHHANSLGAQAHTQRLHRAAQDFLASLRCRHRSATRGAFARTCAWRDCAALPGALILRAVAHRRHQSESVCDGHGYPGGGDARGHDPDSLGRAGEGLRVERAMLSDGFGGEKSLKLRTGSQSERQTAPAFELATACSMKRRPRSPSWMPG
jgi:hypothetical protein